MIALFDLDGVLIDTERQYSAFWEEIGRLYIPSLPTFANDIKGHSLISIFDDYFQATDVQKEIKQRLLNFENQMHYPYMDGAEEMVRRLKNTGINTAIVTSSDKTKMDCVYQEHPEMPLLFDKIFTAEDSARSKPAPDCYLNAARYFNTDIKSCVIFEDSLNGLISGRNSGGKVVGLCTTLTANEVIKYSDMVINDLLEVVHNEQLFKQIIDLSL